MEEKKQKNIKKLAVVAFIVSILSLAIAYTAVSKMMIVVKRNTVISDSRWNVHFDNLESKTSGGAKIIRYPSLKYDKTYIGDFSVSLTKPGDSVLFTYDVVNSGSLRAKYQKTLVNDMEKKNKITLAIAKTIFEEADFDGDGKQNAYEYLVMDDVVFGDHDEVNDSEEEDDLEFDLAIAGLDRDELEDMDEDERREALEDAGLDSDDYDF